MSAAARGAPQRVFSPAAGCGAASVGSEAGRGTAAFVRRRATLLAGAALALAAGAARAESTPEGTRVLGVRAGSACLTERVRVTGFARAHEEGGAGLPAGYRITEILVGLGDAVAAGQELVRAARVAPGGPPQMPDALVLRAPIAGRLTRLDAHVGAITAASTAPEPMVRIAADAGTDLVVDVPSLYAVKIKAGTAVQIRRSDGFEAAGTVRAPVAEVEPRTQLGQARISVEPASALRPGQFASAVIETARDCGLSVPRAAVTYRDGQPTVQVLKGTKVETRSIRTGLSDEGIVQVREGLSEDETVVASAGQALRTGDRVTPVITGKVGDAR